MAGYTFYKPHEKTSYSAYSCHANPSSHFKDQATLYKFGLDVSQTILPKSFRKVLVLREMKFSCAAFEELAFVLIDFSFNKI